MTVTTLGIDLAKNIFHLHGVDALGKVAIQKRVTRANLRETVAQLPPCLIGMEACGSAQYWAREFQQLGHTLRVVFQFGSYSPSDHTAEFNPVHI